MDWGRDYELLKSGGLSDEAGPSFHGHNEDEEDPFGEPMAADVDPGLDNVLQNLRARHWNNLQDIG